ncbi:mucin-5AC-like [Mercenaria mercenaria]|uniref:mucin-5AC-like n=1 Tax=Mercenaria mercenaria TaxID=6596 RepID=UPI00234ECFD2|nr:mucin-5AC-like [Mercenaria mercenaria]
MRARMTKEQSSGKQRSKPQKRKATESIKTPSGKPAAKVLDACSPPGYYPSTTVQVTRNSITVTTTTSAHSTTVTSVSTAPVPAATPAHEAANRLAPEPIDPLPSVPVTVLTGNSITTMTAANSSSVTSVSSTPVLTATPAHDALTPSTPSRPEFSFRSVRPTSGNQLLTYLQGIDAAQGSLMKEVEKLKKQGEATSRKYNEIIDNQRAIRELLER